MKWKAPWSKRPGPVDSRVRELEEQEAELARQMSEIHSQVEALKNTPPETTKPPVWRARESNEGIANNLHSQSNPHPPTRVHRAQQKRDRNFFLLLAFILFLLLLWIIKLIHH